MWGWAEFLHTSSHDGLAAQGGPSCADEEAERRDGRCYGLTTQSRGPAAGADPALARDDLEPGGKAGLQFLWQVSSSPCISASHLYNELNPGQTLLYRWVSGPVNPLKQAKGHV